MKNKNLVSIIIPNYNSQDYISYTIDSILNQSYKNWELIIVDDCSNDNSIHIISNYMKNNDKIKLHILEKNSGRPSIPRNIGIRIANGEYIAFMDADDIWHKRKLELQLKIMFEYNIYFSCTSLVDFKDDIELKYRMLENINDKNIYIKYINHNKLIKKNIIPNSSVIIKKSILDDNNLFFNEDVRYKAIEDFHLWLRVLEYYPYCLKIETTLLFYRLATTSISKSKLSMLKKNYILYSEYKKDSKYSNIKKWYYLYFYIIYSVLRLIKKGI